MTDVNLVSFSNYKRDPKSINVKDKLALVRDHEVVCNNKLRTILDTNNYSGASTDRLLDTDIRSKFRNLARARSLYQDKDLKKGRTGSLNKSRISDAMKMKIYNRDSIKI